MSAEENKERIRRGFEEGVNQRHLELFDELLSPDYVNYGTNPPTRGIDGFRQMMGVFFTGFPDMKVELDEVIGEGDRVVTRGRMTGTHTGEFMGIPATGKPISVNYIDMWRIEDGKGVENWVQMDLVGLMQQLGAVPSPA